jgi:four helix bundle protein
MMALGSTDEVRVLLEFAKDLGYVEETRYVKASTEYEEIKRMLSVLISKVKSNI